MRLDDNVNKDFIEIRYDGMDWIQLAQDKSTGQFCDYSNEP